MKKILSILGAIELTIINTTSLITCNKQNNNENGGNNKSEFTSKPEQPSENSNGKLVNINGQKDRYKFKNEFKKLNNKGYFFIESDTYKFNKYLAKNNGNNIKQVISGNGILMLNNGNYTYFDASKIKSIYCGNELNKPQIPTINHNTSKILDGKN